MPCSGNSSNEGPFIDITLDFNVQHNVLLNPAYILMDMSMAGWPNGYHRNVTICAWWVDTETKTTPVTGHGPRADSEGSGSYCPKHIHAGSRASFQTERIHTKDLDSPTFAMRWVIWTSDPQSGPLIFCMNGLVPQSQPQRRDGRDIDTVGRDGSGGEGAVQELR